MVSGIFVRSIALALAPCRPPSFCDALRAFPVCTSCRNEHEHHRMGGGRTYYFLEHLLKDVQRILCRRGGHGGGATFGVASNTAEAGEMRMPGYVRSTQRSRYLEAVMWPVACGQKRRAEKAVLRPATTADRIRVQLGARFGRG